MLFTDLPSELIVLVLKELDIRSVVNCKRVCRQLRELITANWLQLRRPRMVVYSDHTEKYDGTSQANWRIKVFTYLHEATTRFPAGSGKEFLFFHWNDTLIVDAPECSWTHKRHKAPFWSPELRLFGKFFKNRGFSTRIRRSTKFWKKWLKRDFRGSRLVVTIDSWEEAFELCFELLQSSGHRMRVEDSNRTLSSKIREIVMNMPLKLERFRTQEKVRAPGRPIPELPMILVESLKRSHTQQLFLRLHFSCGMPMIHYWSIKLTEPNPFTAKQVRGAGGNFAHNFKIEMQLDSEELYSIVEMAVAKVMRIEVNRHTLEVIPRMLKTWVEQWSNGLRCIKRITIDPLTDSYDDFQHKNYHLDVQRILHKFSPPRLQATEESSERYLVSSRNYPGSHLLIEGKIVPHMGYGPFFGYIITGGHNFGM